MSTTTQSWSILSRRKRAGAARRSWVAYLRSIFCIVALFAACVGTALAYGPYPLGTTVFVDLANTSGIESGTDAEPFNTIQEAIDAAPAGAIVGVAAGLYTGDHNDNLVISKSLKLIGYDTATTVIEAESVLPASIVTITDAANVDVGIATFTVRGAAALCQDMLKSNIRGRAHLERLVLIGNCTGVYGPGAVIDRSTIVGARFNGVNWPRVVTNSLIIGNGTVGILVWGGEEPLIANNTIVGNRTGILFDPFVELAPALKPSYIVNNILAAHEWYGITSGDVLAPETYGGLDRARVQLVIRHNLFHANALGDFHRTNVVPAVPVFSGDAINALSGNAGNFVADPKFVNAAADNFHLKGSSPAIDAGTNLAAPFHDFDGNLRPVNGDGDCSTSVDIGAYEAPAVRSDPGHAAIECQRYVFEPDHWVLVGCAAVDCCPNCPGSGILDWRIYVIGPPMEAVVLRFERLDRAAARQILIEGAGRWIDENRLLLTGRELTLHGLPFSLSDPASGVRMTVESFSDDQPLTGALAVGISQSVAGRTIAETVLEYPAMSR